MVSQRILLLVFGNADRHSGTKHACLDSGKNNTTSQFRKSRTLRAQVVNFSSEIELRAEKARSAG